MRQLEFELEWLTDPEWIPESVVTYRGKVEMSNNAFDDYQAMQYGYESYNDMISQMNKKHQEKKAKFGDRYIQGWMK